MATEYLQKMNRNKDKSRFDRRRTQTEELLAKNSGAIQSILPEDVKKLVNELYIHRIELEKQNEELHQARSEIVESQSKYAVLYDFAPIGYFTIDRYDTIYDVNFTGASLLGFERDVLINKMFPVFIARDFKKIYLEHRNLVLKTQAKQICDLKLLKKDGSGFYAQLDSIVVKDSRSNITGFWTSITDITERKRAENKQRKLEKQLLQSQKMEAIGILADGIAHDFNNIIQSTIGFLRLLERNMKRKNEKQRIYLKGIKAGVNRGAALADHLLSFSRPDRRERRVTDIKKIVEESVEMLRSTISSTIKIKTHISKRPINILGNPSQIHQVVMNLCVNAAQSISGNGTLRIDLKPCSECKKICGKPEDCKITCPQAVLKIQDTGIGIEEAIKIHVYEPFFTTKPVGKGSGLGLSVVYGIVNNHDGKIFFTSESGKGTTFYVCLPLTGNKKKIKTHTFQTESTAIKRKRVLFVDDDELIVEMANHYFSEGEFSVMTFNSSLKALDFFSVNSDRFDVLITDQTMPDMTGTKLAEKIKQIRKDIPILLLTGYGHKADPDSLKKAGIIKSLHKPIDMDNLVLALRDIFHERA